MSATVPVAALVLNWNGRALTEACVASWRRSRPGPRRLLVVDNGSTDGSVAFLRRRFKGLEILALPSNLGFAAGNNKGFEALRRRGPAVEAVFVCNNDTEVEPDMLGLLWRSLDEHPRWGAAGPRILFHGSRRVWFEGALIRTLSGRSRHLGYGLEAGPGGEAFELPAQGFVSGCGLLVRSAPLRDLRGFDEGLWSYAEDSDLCLRLRERGLACGVVPRARMSHKVSSTFVLGSPMKEYYDTRNSYALLRRHRLGYGALTRSAFVFANLARAARALALGSPAAARAILDGLSDGVRGIFPMRLVPAVKGPR
ncbi:MAG TPA: glycosyltransferase family 2 protein [bacterium]|jgi:GT2 family glycosyltransferase|nr:glycosyltransferase family 2 protein [bacterium]